jgi:hypothetical protein
LLLIILLVLTFCFLKQFLYLFTLTNHFLAGMDLTPMAAPSLFGLAAVLRGEMLGGLGGEVLTDTLGGRMATKGGAVGGLNDGRSNIGS